MDYPADNPHRLQLAEAAAAGDNVTSRLRLLMLAETLSAPPARRTLDLNAETAALCNAAVEAVRRRPGWLYLVPAPAPLPVLLPRRVWQAVVLCLLRGVQPAGRAVLTLQAGSNAAVAVFRAVQATRLPDDTLPLLRRAATLTGGVCVTLDAKDTTFAAALRLPLTRCAPPCAPAVAGDLLDDRCSILYALLDGFTV